MDPNQRGVLFPIPARWLVGRRRREVAVMNNIIAYRPLAPSELRCGRFAVVEFRFVGFECVEFRCVELCR